MSKFNPHDHFFNKAKNQGFKARSVFKLEEIDKRLKLFKKDSVVLDLGCAPGSWLQYVGKVIGAKGAALGVDLTAITQNLGARILTVQDDCFLLTKEKIESYLKPLLNNFTSFDVILSDMAPKTTGIKHVDQIRSLELAKSALDLAHELLKPGGHVVIKIFEGEDSKAFLDSMKKKFKEVKKMRPSGVRSVSKEFYAIGVSKL